MVLNECYRSGSNGAFLDSFHASFRIRLSSCTVHTNAHAHQDIATSDWTMPPAQLTRWTPGCRCFWPTLAYLGDLRPNWNWMSLFLAYLGALRPNWNWMYIDVCKAGSWTPGCRCFWPTWAFAPELELDVLHASTYVQPVHGHQDVVVSGLPWRFAPELELDVHRRT
jgi:hypothetical protein